MTDLDKFLTFVFSHIDDDRFELSKKMKYGFCYYYIYINLKFPEDISGNNFGGDTKQLTIIIDNRNMCIEIGQWEDLLVIEDVNLVKKWSDILEEHYQKKLGPSLKFKVENFLNNTDVKDKDLWREWTMDKLFEEFPVNDENKKTDTE